MNQGKRAGEGLNAKTMLIGAAATSVACMCAVHSLIALLSTKLSTDWFPFGASIAFLLVLFLVNPILRLIRPSMELTRNELLLVFVIVFSGVPMSNVGFAETFLSQLTSLLHFATPANQWGAKLAQYLPHWLYPADNRALEWFWTGLPPGESVPWLAWASPLAHWAILLVSIYGIMVALAAIFRRQWMENERLIYPLMEVPAALTEGFEDGRRIPPVMRDRLFWIGVAVPIAVFSTHILNWVAPAFPRFNLLGKDILNVQPADTWYPLRNHVFPCAVAFGFLVNRDVLLSVWGFGLLIYLERNIMKMTGYSAGPSIMSEDFIQNPALAWQAFGGLIVYVLAGLFMARRHLARVARKAILGAADVDDSHEPMRYRWAVWLLILGLATAWVFLVKTGMGRGMAAAMLLVTVMLYLAVTRFVIEGGLVLCGPPIAATAAMVGLFGAGNLPAACFGALVATLPWVTNTDTGFMPALANSLKLAEGRPLRSRSILKAAILGVCVGAVASFAALSLFAYGKGAVNSQGGAMRAGGQADSSFSLYAREHIFGPDKVRLGWGAVGAGITTILIAGRYAFAWWPLHPIGLMVIPTFGGQMSFFSIFLAWAAKTLILRIGGAPLYLKAKPFFYGLLIGHIVIVAIGFLVDCFRIPPGMNLYV